MKKKKMLAEIVDLNNRIADKNIALALTNQIIQELSKSEVDSYRASQLHRVIEITAAGVSK
jgi:hypothetical protein